MCSCDETLKEVQAKIGDFFFFKKSIVHKKSIITIACSVCGEEEDVFIVGGVTWGGKYSDE